MKRPSLRAAVWSSLALGGFACAPLAPDPAAMARDLAVEPAADARELANAETRARSILDELVESDGGWEASDRDCERARDLVEEVPASAWAHTALAVALAAEARRESPPMLATWREAEGEFLRARRLRPNDVDLALLHADFLVLDGHYEAAVDRLDQVLSSRPDDERLVRAAAGLHFDRGAESRTIDLCERLVNLGVATSSDLWMLAESRLRLAPTESLPARRAVSFERAAQAFVVYREARPDDLDGALGEAAARYGRALSGRDTESEAAELLAFYDDLIARWPGRAALLHGAGSAAELSSDPDLAEGYYRRTLAADPEHLPAHLNLAAILADRRDPVTSEPLPEALEESRSLARRALQLDNLQVESQRLDTAERRALEQFVNGPSNPSDAAGPSDPASPPDPQPPEASGDGSSAAQTPRIE